jgi:hypothetical protein
MYLHINLFITLEYACEVTTAGDSFSVVEAIEYFAPAKLYLKECYSFVVLPLASQHCPQVVSTY